MMLDVYVQQEEADVLFELLINREKKSKLILFWYM